MRAGIVTDPADYRFCSYGVWAQRGHHPFAEALVAHLISALPARLRNLTPQEVGEELKRRFRKESQEVAPVADSLMKWPRPTPKQRYLAQLVPTTHSSLPLFGGVCVTGLMV